MEEYESNIRLFVDDCVIYKKIINKEDIEKLQKVLDRLEVWAVENAMKINPSKSKAVRFTRARLKDITRLFVSEHINTGSEQL